MLPMAVSAHPDLDPAVSQFFDQSLLEAAPREPYCARLRVYRLAGDVLSLGRYHLAPTGATGGRVHVHRRLSGGRVLPLGAGFATVALVLPHRSALVGDEPLALRPEQVLGRCVRALLGALRALGVEAFYPGRDRVTVGGRMLGTVSLESDRHGATAFEAMLAMDDGWPRLADRIASVDRDGVIAAEIAPPQGVTSLAAHGIASTVDQLADAMAESLHRQFALQPMAGVLPSTPGDAAARAHAWVGSRRRRAGLDRHAVAFGQIGVFEVYLAAGDGRIEDIVLAGDFIADSPSIARLEERLRGCPLERAAIAAAVDGVYADPRSFLLGVGPLDTVVDAIARAA